MNDGLIIDLFAGAGGMSQALAAVYGRVDIAINHDPEAIRWHRENHPQTTHYQSGVFEVSPVEVCQGRPVQHLHASPDCTYFSRAKGRKPLRDRERQVRSLAWVVVRWAALVRPAVITMENVAEFQEWGPVRRGRPVKAKKARYFRQFVAHLRTLGYAVEWRELAACDYGAPTTRRRLFLVARADGHAIAWPEPSHGHGRSQPYRTAAECIDWSLPCPSIFTRNRPLAAATLRRIAAGLVRYVLESPRPYIVRICQTSGDGGKVKSLDEPLTTITTKAEHLLVAPFLAKHYGGVVGHRLDRSIGTVTTVDHHSLVVAHLVTMRGTQSAHLHGDPITEPLRTISAGGAHHALVAAFIVSYYGSGGQHQGLDEPMHTIVTKARHGLVTVPINGEDYFIADIGMRMLQPHELAAAQGFAPDYRLPAVKAKAIRLIGNSVCPDVGRALVLANRKLEAHVA